MANLLDRVERSWWSVSLGEARPASGTYGQFDFGGRITASKPFECSGLPVIIEPAGSVRGDRPVGLVEQLDQLAVRIADHHSHADVGVDKHLAAVFGDPFLDFRQIVDS